MGVLSRSALHVLQLNCSPCVHDTMDVDNHEEVLPSIILCDSTGDQSQVSLAMVRQAQLEERGYSCNLAALAHDIQQYQALLVQPSWHRCHSFIRGKHVVESRIILIFLL